MLTIKNINKIVGKSIYVGMNRRTSSTIYDVYDWIDNRYEFIIEISTPKDTKLYRLNLNRNKIPYPVVLKDSWELSYEEAPNQYKVDGISKEDLRDMKEVIRRIGCMMDRILN